ncbi:MAG: hypothetical protein C3F02_03905 [Parcubacteria group bacterium]|nr:MAG: hypothetical protein C3F02_03905 [Parcubacteria group bacterium]
MAANKNKNILQVEKLSVRLSQELIIEDLSFCVDRGEHLTIIGPNGSGKTTLFKALIGVIPYTGTITWASDTVIGYVPQKLDIDRNLPLSLNDFLQSKNYHLKPTDLKKYLDLVHLSERLLPKPLGFLSGGEFQRAMMTLALIGDSNVLLFDEPTAGIDEPSEEEIYETMHRLQAEKGVTIITISHDLSLVNRYADNVLCLNRRGLCYGHPHEIANPSTLAKVFGTKRYKHYDHTHG